MALPIDVKALLRGRIIESGRMEYEETWDPEGTLHTVCAFANDIEELGGGYIVIGASGDGGSVGKVTGITEGEAARIGMELKDLCGLIEPAYVPVLSIESYGDSRLAVIWAVSDTRRPFRCPVPSGTDGADMVCYARRMSRTVRADREEENRLMELSRRMSFDGSACRDASVSDIRRYLVDDFLHRANGGLAGSPVDSVDLYRSMRLVDGPPEDERPLNVALMMFSDSPQRFFPYSRIEVAIIRDEAGRVIDEKTFDGPVDIQIVMALAYLKDAVICERVVKVEDRAEAERFRNYPYEAVREVLVNAMCHRSYGIPEPVKVHVYSDRIEVTSLPGPDPSIPDEDVRALRMRGTFHRNKRLGDLLKELRLTEGRNTGMGMISDAMRRNGSPRPICETDPDRTFLRVTLPIHPGFSTGADPPGRRGRRRDIGGDVLALLDREGCLSTSEIAAALGYAGPTPALRRHIRELIDEGEVAYLYPDSPNDRRQRLCRRGRRGPQDIMSLM